MIQSLPEQTRHLNFPAPLPATLREGHQTFPGAPVRDVGEAVRDALRASGMLPGIKAGARVAVGCGSRGIANLPAATQAVVDLLRAQGARPYVFPAMGSHGGGTAEGQVKLLARLGVTSERVGAEIRADMAVRPTACLEEGLTLYQGLDSARADHVILINRVKPHTSFRGDIESGLAKMSVIGLGKLKGAQSYHAHGMRAFTARLPAAARLQMKHTNVLGGIALVENAREETLAVEALPAAEFAGPRERALLRLARDHMPRIPVSPIDALVVRRLGKNISGTGMDTNVIGRYGVPDVPDAEWPRIAVVAVLSLTADTQGNANGLGLANVVSGRVLEAIDWQATYTNALTAGVMGLRKAALPAVMPSDRQALELALRCTQNPPARARILMIEDTLSLGRVWMSENLAAEWARQADCQVGAATPLAFDAQGTMTAPWSL